MTLIKERAPALTSNILLIFVAPFFQTFEILNEALGYKKQQVREWNKVIARDIASFRQQGRKQQKKEL